LPGGLSGTDNGTLPRQIRGVGLAGVYPFVFRVIAEIEVYLRLARFVTRQINIGAAGCALELVRRSRTFGDFGVGTIALEA
jgi:hypothetical protein